MTGQKFWRVNGSVAAIFLGGQSFGQRNRALSKVAGFVQGTPATPNEPIPARVNRSDCDGTFVNNGVPKHWNAPSSEPSNILKSMRKADGRCSHPGLGFTECTRQPNVCGSVRLSCKLRDRLTPPADCNPVLWEIGVPILERPPPKFFKAKRILVGW